MRFFLSNRAILLFLILLFSITIYVLQYAFNTPHLNNELLEANFYEGFLNGYCLFANSILYSLHAFELVDTPFYFFNYLNPKPEYLNGFVLGFFINAFLMIFSKILEYKKQ